MNIGVITGNRIPMNTETAGTGCTQRMNGGIIGGHSAEQQEYKFQYRHTEINNI